MAASLSYAPQPFEQGYYLGLFQAADVKKTGNIGGAEAVQFFARSKLPIEVLKNIWTVADQPSTSSLDHKKFAVAIRLIQLTQNQTKGTGPTLAAPPGVTLKPAMFEGVSGASVPLPNQGDVPPPTPQQPQRAAMQAPPSPARSMQQQPPPQQQQQQLQPPPTPSRALVGMDPYSLTPQERSRYESLFPQYAKTEEDGQQFVYGSEAVPLFMKSGVDPNILRDIWNMVDRNPVDNKLDKLEFALAMHLIVCISKKNLPIPPGGQLPSSLQALKAVAPNSPMRAPAPAVAAPPQSMQLPPPAAGMPGPPPLGGPDSGAMGGMNISDAFEGLNTSGGPPDYNSQPAPAPEPALPAYVPEPPAPTVVEPPTPQPQPSYVQQPTTIPSAASYDSSTAAPVAAPAPAVTYAVSDSHQEELEKLKATLQNLQAENVSLKAQLGNMTEEEKQVQQEVGQTIAEITSLQGELGTLRQQVLEAKNRLLEARAELKSHKDTKGVLTELISEAQETKEAIESATNSLQNIESAAPPAPAVETADFFDMGAAMTGAPSTIAETVPEVPEPALEGFQNEHSMSSNMPGGVASDTATPLYQQPPVEQPTPQQQPQPVNAAAPEQMYYNYGAEQPPAEQPTPQQQPQPVAPAAPQQMYYNYSVPAPAPPAAAYPSPANTDRPAAVSGHNRQSSGFDDGFLMGGSATAIPQETAPDTDNFSVAAHSIASTGDYGYDDQAFEIVEGMKKRAQAADGAARDAEAASRKLAAEADELRADADRAEANYRSLVAAADEKKKGRFGGGKKKKMMDEAEQAGRDSAEIKKHFIAIQSQAHDAATLAAQTRSEADRLRDEAEAAELQMASAASAKQAQPAPVPAPAPPQTNGYSPKPNYGGMPPAPQRQQQQRMSPVPQYGQMPVPSGGYNNYMNGNGAAGYGNPYGQGPPQMSLPDPSQSAPGVMGNPGGYNMPSPAAFQAPGGDPYANPF